MNLMHELRKDPVLNRWIIAAKTPPATLTDFVTKEKEEPDDPQSCLLCAGREAGTPPEITAVREKGSKPNSSGWLTRVIPNFKPMLQIEGELNSEGMGMYDKINGVGANELIIETPEHIMNNRELDVRHVTRTLLMYKERILDLENDKRLRYILISKSYGKAAGALYSHPHSQLTASPIIPQRIKEELDSAKAYYKMKERCIFCDILREEEKTGERIVLESRDFIAFCPFASAFPFEIWIVPRKHECSFQETEGKEIEDLGLAIFTLLNKLAKLLNDPPYNLALHNAPNRVPRREHWHTLGDDFHWHIEIVPRLSTPAFEWSSGFYLLNIPPEAGAKYLREV
ncbi:MAG: galactose-1-phosphate uridylyltransferase [Nitrospirae bacterium]|nr:galactose-1-phosphate uridylyltransferase [Nitrospirota bacterium]